MGSMGSYVRNSRLVWMFVLGLALSILPACGGGPPPSPYGTYVPPASSSDPGTRQPGSGPPYNLNRSRVQVVERPLTSGSAGGSAVHEVAPMETLWRISKMYDVPVDTICQANGMRSGDPIKIGQKLMIPNARGFRNVIPLYPNTKWKYIIIHHTATEIGKAMLIDRAHNDRGFWQGLGYHFLIDNGTLEKGDGQIEASPRWIKQQDGAHCKAGGMNYQGIGVALVGNFTYETPTARQMDSLAYLLETLMRYYGISAANVMGHRDVPGANTECPGRLFPWSTVRQSIAGPWR